MKCIKSYLSSIFNFGDLSDDELKIMQQIACLPSEYISFNILMELLVVRKDGNCKLNFEYEAEFLSSILEELCEKGWLLKNSSEYKMHQLISWVVKNKGIEPATSSVIIESVTDKLSINSSKDNTIDKFKWVHFGEAILESDICEDEKKIANLQNNLAVVLKEQGRWFEAKDLLEKAILIEEKSHHKNEER